MSLVVIILVHLSITRALPVCANVCVGTGFGHVNLVAVGSVRINLEERVDLVLARVGSAPDDLEDSLASEDLTEG